jgi:RND family efflux transporter MFP subunit
VAFKQAKGNLDRLLSVLKQAELGLEIQRGKSEVDVRKAESDLRIAKARLDAAISGARQQEIEQMRARKENAKRNLERLSALAESKMISGDQVESAQLQYEIYSAQLSLLEEGSRPEDIQVLKAQVEVAEASLESAQSNKMVVDVKESALEAAKAQAESAKASFEQASVERDSATWEKDLAQAEALLTRAEASLDLAKQRLEDSIIRSPIAGVITERFLDKGDTASSNRPCVNIAKMDIVKVIARVPAREIVHIKLGDEAAIKPDVYPNESFSGTVTRISPLIDRSSQNCDVEIEVNNPDYRLKPGMWTPVELEVSERNDVPLIPVDVMIKESERTFAYTVVEGKASKRRVVTGISDGLKAEVISGINVGEMLVVSGQNSLRDGMSVTIMGEEPRKPGRGEGR